MGTLFRTGIKNAGKKFAASGGLVYTADEDGLIDVSDPTHMAEFKNVFRVFDPDNPEPAEEVTVAQQKRRDQAEGVLLRLDVPSDAAVQAAEAFEDEPSPATPAAPPQPDQAAPAAPATPTKPWLSRVLSGVTGGGDPAAPATDQTAAPAADPAATGGTTPSGS